MSWAAESAQLAAGFIDLDVLPFTVPGSRLLVSRNPNGSLRVCRAEYEVHPRDAVVVTELQVTGADGTPSLITDVLVDRIEFGDAASLVLEGSDRMSIGGGASGVRLLLPSGAELVRDIAAGQALDIRLAGPPEPTATTGDDHAGRLAGSRQLLLDWFARCPRVATAQQPIVAHCWWVLGANTLELAVTPGRRAVVPSKLGYVGLWQWDAYFIAIGLRHGDLDLAAEQLELALSHPGADGQLPDVLHDTGVLSSSDDLPPGDLARLRELASPAADPAVPVPLTKPPLAALAIALLAEAGLQPDRVIRLLPAVQHSQDWWMTTSFAADGLPEYGHPYSSGLDDSPVFDRDLPVATPDLAAYLVLQDRILSELADGIGDHTAAIRHSRRAEATRELLLRMWDHTDRRFRSRCSTGAVPCHAIVDLLPLLVGDLPSEISMSIVGELDDPDRFGTPFPAPTVARSDQDFSPNRMWRGPVWVNTNWLLINGLLRSGYEQRAIELARATVRLVTEAGGAHEYFSPLTAERPAGAVAMFSWSAALVIDLAVWLAVVDR